MNKSHSPLLHRALSFVVLFSMLIAQIAVAAPIQTIGDTTENDKTLTKKLQKTGTPSGFLFRARVTLRNSLERQRLDALGAVILEEDGDEILLLATANTLAALARLRFNPRGIDALENLAANNRAAYPNLLSGLDGLFIEATTAKTDTNIAYLLTEEADNALQKALHAFSAETKVALAMADADDSDGDGLTDTEESWWCTDPLNPNSDGDADGYSDGEEVTALLDFTLPRNVRWGYGPPFGPPNAWPDFNGIDGNPDTPACNDGDGDTIPDFAEVYIVGSNTLNESTDGDKFDDGQELFGVTYCPGAAGSCGHGLYPRSEYWNYIQANMPNWVEPPGDNLFVAAFPVPEVSVVAGSWAVERVTTITTEEGQMAETTNSYATSVMQGQSTSIANTVTWNEWEEVSESVETPLNYHQVHQPLDRDWGKVIGGGSLYLGGEIVSCLSGGIPEAIATLGITLGLCIAGDTASNIGWDAMMDGWNEGSDSDSVQPSALYPPQNIDVSSSSIANASVTLNQNFDFQGVVHSLDGVQYAINQQGQLLARGLYDISYQISRPRYTETKTNGRSWGGAQTTTHEVYEEHSITQGEAFTTGQNWSTAWAVDSSHAADLTFDYTIENTGTEYAREISGLIFNIYLGDDSSPIVSYPAWEQFPSGKLENVFPGDSHTFASNPVPLTLEQMKRIDLGEKITVIMEDFSYGADELFYQDAVNGGVTIFIEDGVEDDDELVDMYVVPTWGVETVQDVLTRYFPAGIDDDGNINSLWTPEFDGVNPPSWNEHFLSDIAWWNIYLTQTDAGNTPLHELAAAQGSALLFRFNRDSDRDGYQDRVEDRYSTDKDDPASHPYPEVLAGYTATQDGDEVTVLLKLSNSGSFDAYGIDAVMYAPDDTVTIGNNTVGGNGRVRPNSQIAVGSLILAPNLDNWTTSTSQLYAAGNYSGDADKTITFTVSTAGVVGQGSAALDWTDGTTSDTLDLGSSYHAPLPIPITEGVYVGFDTGTVMSGDSFTIDALTPRDTFTYTINSSPHTPPVIVVSYSDPQGSHRFVTPIELATLGDDLTAYSGQMLPDVGVSIITSDTVDSTGTNTTHFIINSPHPEPIENGHLYLNFVADGELVAEMPYTMTLQPGPTVIPVQWTTDTFSQTYDAEADNILIAFWTDVQDNIIDSAARPLNTFQHDPTAVAHVTPTTWDFGTLTQGESAQTEIAVANSGFSNLYDGTVINGDGLTVSNIAGNTTFPATFRELLLTVDTAQLPVGSYAGTVMIQTSDIDTPQTVINVTGIIAPLTGEALAYGVSMYRPWDQTVYISGTHNLNDTITFDHTILDVPEQAHPLYVYAADETTLLGIGEYGPDFTGTTASSNIFGDGSDGDLIVGSGQTVYTDDIRTELSNSASSGQNSICVASTSGLQIGDEVLTIQIQGTGAGNYEFGKITDINTCWLTLQNNLENTYTIIDSATQVLRVPNYQNVTIQDGGVLTAHAWNGSTGGVVAFRAMGIVTIQSGGSVDLTGKGFDGGETVCFDNAFQGNSTTGNGVISITANGTGGGGGHQGDGAGAGSGGGGGLGSIGEPGGSGARPGGEGGESGGNAELTNLIFGGGGGGGGTRDACASSGGRGGNSGGIVFISSQNIVIDGSSSIKSDGDDGYSKTGAESSGGGGGGSGGSILIRVQMATIGTILISASGGIGGAGTGTIGGTGGNGRIRIEYCNYLTGTTNPPASTEQITCYIVRQLAGTPNTELTLPEEVNDYARYHIQYGQGNNFSSAGTQTYSVTLPKQVYDYLTFDALFQNLGSTNFNFMVDIGADSSAEWSGSGSEQPVIISSPNPAALAAGLNVYLSTTPDAWGTAVTIPILVTLDSSGDMFLTNLTAVTESGGDAEAGDISFSNDTPTQGDVITIQTTVSNTASLPINNIIAAFFAGDPMQDGIYLGSDFISEIAAGETTVATLSWDTDNFGDDIDVYTVFDLAEQIAETNENNNSTSQFIHVKSRADLHITSLSAAQQYPRNGIGITVTAVLSNSGETDSDAFALSLYDDSDLVQTVTHTIPAGQQMDITILWTPTHMGGHVVRAIADSGNAIAESNESNNETSESIFVGLYDYFYADSGDTSDLPYDPAPTIGYGWLLGTAGSWDNTPEGTYRWNDVGGPVRYQFDYLVPDADYHVDVTLLDGDGGLHGTESLWIDNLLQGEKDLSDGLVHWLSIRPDSILYEDHSLIVDITSDGLGGAVVSEIALREIDYRYIDPSPDTILDPPYSSELGYGYLNGFATALWGDTPIETIRLATGTDTVMYRFDGLDIARNYQINVTLYQEDAEDRQQTILFDGLESGLTLVPTDTPVTTEIAVPKVTYNIDGSVVVGIQRMNGNAPIINTLSLEERTIPWEGDTDSQSPLITNIIYNPNVASLEALEVSAEISDSNTGNNGISSAWITYGYTFPYDDIVVMGIPPNGSSGDGVWTFTIPAQGSEYEGQTLYFSVSAFDGDDTPETAVDDNNGAYYAAAITESTTADYYIYLPTIMN